jgi:hypothetical protein
MAYVEGPALWTGLSNIRDLAGALSTKRQQSLLRPDKLLACPRQ